MRVVAISARMNWDELTKIHDARMGDRVAGAGRANFKMCDGRK
jgi:hypothetical protein